MLSDEMGDTISLNNMRRLAPWGVMGWLSFLRPIRLSREHKWDLVNSNRCVYETTQMHLITPTQVTDPVVIHTHSADEA